MRIQGLRWTLVPPPERATVMQPDSRETPASPMPAGNAMLGATSPAGPAVLPMVTVLQDHRITLDPTFTAHDAAVFLLQIAAEIEHALMAQYLFTAWSLGGDQVPPDKRDEVNGWRDTMIEIAREEMGHLVTVQNLLRLIGGPLILDRHEYPFASDIYPFPFRLERARKKVIARYVAAEMPRLENIADAAMRDRLQNVILPEANNGQPTMVNRVGALYAALSELFSAPGTPPPANPILEPPLRLEDGDFLTDVGDFPAKAEDWGFTEHAILIPTITNRAEAQAALKAISEQGEGVDLPGNIADSHFSRFFTIFDGVDAAESQSILVAHPHVPDNPATDSRNAGSVIVNPEARLWAHLFNVRYRLLLNFLLHFLGRNEPVYVEQDIPNGPTQGDRTATGLLHLYTFGEMRHLKKLGDLLMSVPQWTAGPPFELPYTLAMPDREQDRWRAHRDVLKASRQITTQLLGIIADPANSSEGRFLTALQTADDRMIQVCEAAIAGNSLPPQPQGFRKVVLILEEAVRGFEIPGAPHGAFWRGLTRDQFVALEVSLGGDSTVPLLAKKASGEFDEMNSNLVKALDGTLGIGRMPPNRPPVPNARIAFVRNWIKAGAPDDTPPGQQGGVGEPVPEAPVSIPIPPEKRLSEVKAILEEAVGETDIGAHENFWRDYTRDDFLHKPVFGKLLIASKPDNTFDEEESNLIKALEGRAPFGKDLTPPPAGSTLRRMPAGRTPVPPEKIAIIRKWIRDGCPDDAA